MFYLTTHSTHFIYGYMVSDIWLRTILIEKKETRCRHICYSFRPTARVLLYAPPHREDSIYHGLCYTSRGLIHCMLYEHSVFLLITSKYYIHKTRQVNFILHWTLANCTKWKVRLAYHDEESSPHLRNEGMFNDTPAKITWSIGCQKKMVLN